MGLSYSSEQINLEDESKIQKEGGTSHQPTVVYRESVDSSLEIKWPLGLRERPDSTHNKDACYLLKTENRMAPHEQLKVILSCVSGRG